MKWLRGVWKGVVGVLLLAGLTVTLDECSSPPKEIPFETVKKDPNFDLLGPASQTMKDEPWLIVMSQHEEVAQLDASFVAPEVLTQLRGLDFDKLLAIVVFQGRKPSTGWGIEVNRIEKKRDDVILDTHFQQLWERVGRDVVTLPYHAITLQKTR